MNLLDLCDDIHLVIGDKLAIHQRTLHRKNMHNFSYMVRHFLHTYRRTKWDNYANLRTFLPFRQHSYGRACEYRRVAHQYYWGDGLRKETILHSKMSRLVIGKCFADNGLTFKLRWNRQDMVDDLLSHNICQFY